MAILANRVKTNGHLSEVVRLLLFVCRQGATSALLICSILLIASNAQIVSRYSLEVAGRTVEACSLVFRAVESSFSFVGDKISLYKNVEAENTRLRIELAKLQGASELNVVLSMENDSLKELLHVREKKDISFVSAKLLSISKTPYSSTAIIAAGSSQEVALNDIVTSAHGLVGRVIEVSPGYSTIMLVDDYNSRIPAITGKTGTRGILAVHENEIRLIYLQHDKLPKVGEIVYSSGDGKIFPDGIKIGQVIKSSSEGVVIEPAVLGRNAKPLDHNFVMVRSLDRIKR